MSNRTRRIAVIVSAGTLLSGAGLTVAQAAKTTTNASGVTAAKTRAGGPGGQRGAMSTAGLAKIASALGVSSADLKAALDAARPAAPTGDSAGRGPGDLAAGLASALGVDTASVTAILDASRPAPPSGAPAKGSRPARPDASALVTALASGLNLDETTVKAAFDKLETTHKAADQARHTAMFKAVADKLGLTTDAVQAAFEANRPAQPTR